MSDDRPRDVPEPWPEPPGCPTCGAPNHLGAATCWLCGAALPSDRARVDPPARPVPVEPPSWRWPRPRITIATLMVAIGVIAVCFAVGRGQAGIVVGLILMVGPAVGYLVARARRVDRGLEHPSTVERALGEVAVTILGVTAVAAVAAAAAIVIIGLLRSIAGPP